MGNTYSPPPGEDLFAKMQVKVFFFSSREKRDQTSTLSRPCSRETYGIIDDSFP